MRSRFFPSEIQVLRVALERTSVIGRIAIRRKSNSNSDTSIAWAKSIKLRLSPGEAQLAWIIPLNLSSAPHSILTLLKLQSFTYVDRTVDHSRIGGIDRAELVRANVVLSSEDGASRQAGGLNVGFSYTLEYSIGCPIIAEGLQVE